MPPSPTRINLGRAGEFYVSHLLEMAGCHVVVANSIQSDLWVETPQGTHLRVEVKTATPNAHSPARKNKYAFNLSRRKGHIQQRTPPDYFALVAMDLQQVLFLPSAGAQRRILRVAAEDFSISSTASGVRYIAAK